MGVGVERRLGARRRALPGRWSGARSGVRRAPLTIKLVIAFVALIALCALLGAALAPHDPDEQHLVLGVIGPDPTHWLGTDGLGRDVFSRVVAGARTALAGPLLIALGSLLIGNAVGVLAGFRGGVADALLMRTVDVLYAVPPLLVALVVVGITGGGYLVAVVILIVLFAPYDARLVRGATLEVKALAYVQAARLIGVPSWRIMLFEVWPNVAPVAVAQAMINFAYALVALAGLSFLGVGVPPGAADWGRMLFENQAVMYDNPYAVIGPAIAVLAVAASVNLLGDWIYEGISDRGRAR